MDSKNKPTNILVKFHFVKKTKNTLFRLFFCTFWATNIFGPRLSRPLKVELCINTFNFCKSLGFECSNMKPWNQLQLTELWSCALKSRTMLKAFEKYINIRRKI